MFFCVAAQGQAVFWGGIFYCEVPEWMVGNVVPREGDGITIFGPVAGQYLMGGEGPALTAEISEEERTVRVAKGDDNPCQECRVGRAVGISMGNLSRGVWTVSSVDLGFTFAFEVFAALEAPTLSARVVDGELEVSWESAADRDYVLMDSKDLRQWGNFVGLGGTGERMVWRYSLAEEGRAIRMQVGSKRKAVNLSDAACGGRDI